MQVGLIGTGMVGTTMGSRLLKAGHSLVIHDIEPQAMAMLEARGAKVVSSPRMVASMSTVVFSAVPTPREAQEICWGTEGLLEGAIPGLTHIEMSTVGAPCVRELAARESGSGIRFLEAPVSAGPQEGDHQELTLWVGGPAALFAEHRTLLGHVAEHVIFCGPVGNAQIVKLVNNIITLAFSVILGEGLCLGVKAGIPLEILRLALFWGTAQNRLMDDLFPFSVFSGNWRPGYTTEMAEKDWNLALALSEEAQVPLSTMNFLGPCFAAARERGWSDISVHSLVRLSEEASGVTLRLQPFSTGTD